MSCSKSGNKSEEAEKAKMLLRLEPASLSRHSLAMTESESSRGGMGEGRALAGKEIQGSTALAGCGKVRSESHLSPLNGVAQHPFLHKGKSS